MEKQVICPYCGAREDLADRKKEFTVSCLNCEKKYKVKVGKVRVLNERGARALKKKVEYRVRFVDDDNKEEFIKFKSKNDIELRAGDEVSFSYKKKILSGEFRDVPELMI